jgi:hypothetical protein
MCNALLRRLSKARDSVLGARVLLLLTRANSLAERSGVNNTVSPNPPLSGTARGRPHAQHW